MSDDGGSIVTHIRPSLTTVVEALLSNSPSITFTLAAEADFNTILEEDSRPAGS
jgi:hypothetical protein